MSVQEESIRAGWSVGDNVRSLEQGRRAPDELQCMQLLHQVCERLVSEDRAEIMYDEILRVARGLASADGAMLQILDEATGELVLIAEQGLDPGLVAHFARVDARSGTSCGRALQSGEASFVRFDDPSVADPEGSLRLHFATGLRAAQSTPLRNRSGRTIGMMTTHWREPHVPPERVRRFLDLLAHHAADLLERKQVDDALRASEVQLSRELQDLRLLQDISTRLVEADDVGALLGRLLEAAISLMHSDCGSVQMFDEARDELQLLASHGFTEEAARHWSRVGGGSTTSCSEAMRGTARVIVEDIETVRGLAPVELTQFRACGIRACQSTPLLSRDGRLVGILSTHWRRPGRPTERELHLLDVIARQAADLIERRRAEETLRASDRRKDEFLATLAHELRNPLAPLRHGVQIARVRSRGDESLQRVVDMMDRQLTHLVRLVDDLLDVGRIHSGKLELRRQTVSLHDVLVNGIEASRALLESQQQEVTLESNTGPLRVKGDFDRLVQVFTNLLANAAKYSPPGARIRVALVRDDGDGVVTVRDEGIGIPASELPRVFELFSQVRSRQGRTDGGLGIGLAIVKSLVTLHGGTVAAFSAGTGKGSTFTVRLPLVPPPTLRAAVQDEPSTGRELARRRVLVVDDNIDAGDSLAALLQLLGHEVSVARDGLEAIDCVRAQVPDLILLDLGMPRMDGIEAAGHIRAMPGGESIVIAALTGWGQQADRQRTQAAGFDLHLVKPVDEALLLDALERAAVH